MNSLVARPGAAAPLAYRPDIDGLRAVAVLAVLIFHAFPRSLPGGFIGVDVFFVISGYLISSIILSSLGRGEFTLRDFYLRRVRRIFPALILVLSATLVFGWFALLADEFARLGKHVAAGALFLTNIVSLHESGYFDTTAATKPLLHLWSLGIEEQFYLVWPPLLAFASRRHGGVAALLLGVAGASFAVNVYLAGHNAVAACYSPWSGVWELMLGGILAHASQRGPQAPPGRSDLKAFAGALLLVAGFLCIKPARAFPGWWALLPVGGAFCLIAAGPEAWINRAVLARRPLVAIGLVSYPLYLWHWPLLAYAQILSGGVPAAGVRLGLLLCALLLAWATYRGVERPFRARPIERFPVALTLGLMGAVFASALLGYAQILAPKNRYPVFEAAANFGDFEYLNDLPTAQRGGVGVYTLPSANPEVTLLLGDSHMAQYAPRVGAFIGGHPQARTAVFVVSGGCPPLPEVLDDAPDHDKCRDVRARGFALLQSDAVKAVVFGAAWAQYLLPREPGTNENPSRYDYYFLDHGVKRYLDRGPAVALALAHFERFLAQLGRHKQVFLLLDNPEGSRFDPHQFLPRFLLARPAQVPPAAAVQADPAQERIRAALIELALHAGVRLIDPTERLCRDSRCVRVDAQGDPIYKDANHLGARWIAAHADYLDVAYADPR